MSGIYQMPFFVYRNTKEGRGERNGSDVTVFTRRSYKRSGYLRAGIHLCCRIGRLRKKMFWERQAKDALERLRGTVFQFENIKKEQVISTCEYERIRKMLLDGEETFFQILEGVFYHAERNRGIKAYEIQVEMQAMFDSLYEDILVRYEYFPLYFEKEEMTLSEKQISTEELREEILAIARKIYYLVTKFNIHTDSELIRQVAEYAWENVENDISLEKIADTFFVNKTYLSHLFKQETGKKFCEFLYRDPYAPQPCLAPASL